MCALKSLLGLMLLIILILNATTCESRRINKRYADAVFKAFKSQSTYYDAYVRTAIAPEAKLQQWGTASELLYRSLSNISDNKVSDKLLVVIKQSLQQKSYDFATKIKLSNPNTINAIFIFNDIKPLALEIDCLQSAFEKHVKNKGY